MSDSEEEVYEYSDDDYEESPSMMQEEDDDDMEWNNDDENPNAAPVHMEEEAIPTPKASKTGVRMMHCDELRPEMVQRIQDVVDVLGLPKSAAQVLLHEYDWSKERLLEAFYKDEDPSSLLKKCGIYHRCQPDKSSQGKTRTSARLKPKAQALCDICYEEPNHKLWGMPCGHEFCKDCWRDFTENAVAEGPSQCLRKTCPRTNCPEVLVAEDVAQVAPSSLPKFQSYQLRAFVERNALTRWCPGKGCDKVACASSASAVEQYGGRVSCVDCGALFCLVCGQEPHAPVACPELATWQEKCRNESETANWILANTKACPKCSSRIEKNQGCNHMTCQRCRHEFCWICNGDWSQHGANTGGYYKCNKYDASAPDDNTDQSDTARAKRELDRYLHYYKRYHAHDQAQKFAQKQLKETEHRMVLLQESCENAKWTDVEFLKTANEQLVECRRVLKYTYTFAYYLTDESKKMQKERFEHHQEMLERFTECLSELSEKSLNDMDRTDVVNQTRVVDRFMKNILKYVEDGMEEIPGAF